MHNNKGSEQEASTRIGGEGELARDCIRHWPVLHGLAVVCLLAAGSTTAYGACSDEDLLISRDLASQAAVSDNDTIRLLLLKRSVSTCSSYPVWLELGKLQMQLDNPFDAVYAFEHAVDFQQVSPAGVTPDQLLRRAIANARLGEAYLASDELAMALVAAQEAMDAFEQLEMPVPRRLEHLLAKLDDAISKADADVMKRSIEVQQDRASRGLGIALQLLAPVEVRDTVSESLQLLADYSGDPVMSIEASGLPFSEPVDSNEPTPMALRVPTAKQPTEARLNIPVLFEFDSARLTEASQATIAQLAAALAQLELDEKDSVMVVGHTDSHGASAYNMKLSRDRAEVVAEVLGTLLSSDSAPTVKLQFQGRGETELRYRGDELDDHRRNRRVEVIVRQQ